MKKFAIFAVSITAILLIANYFANYSQPVSAQTTTSTAATSTADMIHVTAPQRNALVSSPLLVTGQARGQWFFEGTFPIRLLNASGTVIAQGQGRAQGTSTTTSFVPFTSTLTFSDPGTDTGTLILSNDNPSGMASTSMSVSIPVRFTAGLPNTGGRVSWFSLDFLNRF